MATKQAHKRLTKEYKMMNENPTPFIMARPNEANILEWHYIINGPPDSPYFEGQYHGTLTFPSDYPYKPPAIRMITPNGRFKENTRLCLSMSDYHPDTWNPGWSVATILNGLLSFMTGDEITTGSITTTEQQKKILAKKSMDYNTHHNIRFQTVFPDIVETNIEALDERKRANASNSSGQNESLNEKRDVIADAAKEKPISLEEILDPEDRIRAEQALSYKEQNSEDNKTNNSNGKYPSMYIIVAIIFFALGFSIKSK
ncbi:hypothetical protein TPHA_0K00820 [Tetrapisispora phaffii CBS 4417]|uniref:Ubiquitin-conjugating enzyme E2 6 n=1 Tax=Tetrapisispora phaffii (strain ATCC 24235 / CBS 4417 / NBRC 1672 / NRRL Y-8282 / UCD 70-5) TaxID=1071381 RepID=G8BZ88_TETPH|nr:hypothetical protein TPHA_0K00820 [Tetrapisispora phaffii CBS 4417]CCE65216.1 hypothetical protein TPHA_0K00820 [Tetrapisispora phaffii CBS 4417]